MGFCSVGLQKISGYSGKAATSNAIPATYYEICLKVAGFNRSGWPDWIGMGGRFES